METGSSMTSKRINVLTLDGGGVRGISTLVILRALMQQINESIRAGRGRGIEHQDVEPHDIFDLVAGTSTGGLIAIMLGKLGMTIEQCIKAYHDLSATIFGKKHLRGRFTGGLAPAKYSGSRMRDCVRKLIHKHRSNEDLPMSAEQSADKIACALICREHRETSRYSDFRPDAVCICSLSCPDPVECLVCDAARATSAAPTYFPVEKISGRYFVDGGMEFNNPTHEIFRHYNKQNRVAESKRASVALKAAVLTEHHGDLDFSEVRFINLGTGTELVSEESRSQSQKSRSQSHFAFLIPGALRMFLFLTRNLTKMATNSERVADQMMSLALVSSRGNICTKYERFSADNGVCFIKMDKYKKLAEIERLTLEYLGSEAVRENLKRVAEEIGREYLEKTSPRAEGLATDTLTVPSDTSRRPQTPLSHKPPTSSQSTDTSSSARRSAEHSDSSAENTPSRRSMSTAPSSMVDDSPSKQAPTVSRSRLTDKVVTAVVGNGPLLVN